MPDAATLQTQSTMASLVLPETDDIYTLNKLLEFDIIGPLKMMTGKTTDADLATIALQSDFWPRLVKMVRNIRNSK